MLDFNRIAYQIDNIQATTSELPSVEIDFPVAVLEFNRIAYQIDALTIGQSSDPAPEPKPERSNAPVTRAKWAATGLPAGLTLSQTGQLSGRPTQVGTYDVDVTVTTNWGSHTQGIRIIVK